MVRNNIFKGMSSIASIQLILNMNYDVEFSLGVSDVKGVSFMPRAIS